MDLIKTINENDDITLHSENSEEEEDFQPTKQRKKKLTDFDVGFEFASSKEEYNKDTWNDLAKYIKRNVKSKVDEKIAKVRKKLRKEKEGTIESGDFDDEDEDNYDDNNDDELSLSEDELQKDAIKEKQKQESKKKKKVKKMGLEQRDDNESSGQMEDFFEDGPSYDKNISFYEMNLSRPLMKAITTMSFLHPTPIQASTIPVALQGRDICGCAATGTGKTAAYMLPTLERLIYKPSFGIPVTRVVVLVPTRELGVQVYQVTKQLSQFTSIETSLSVGGLDVKVQEAALRRTPDIVIATPGRLIDHLKNSPTFNLATVEILILDEADRMLDEYFQEQMTEIIKQCSRTRQTLLFSATMTDAVTDLASVSLSKPVKIFVDNNKDVAFNLRQEFVKIRKQNISYREAVLAALVCRTFHDHAMVFVPTKKQAHKVHILLGLLGIKIGELHGNMTQPQRLEALRKFTEEEVDILVATDVAARGLDIRGVKTVINFMLPPTVEHYIHRVGRTARAGRAGVSVTLCADSIPERKIVREIIKSARSSVKRRVIPIEIVEKYQKKVDHLEEQIATIIKEEDEERVIQRAEDQMNKMKNILDNNERLEQHRDWFQTKKERLAEKDRLKNSESSEKNRIIKTNTGKGKKKNANKERKLTGKQKKKQAEPVVQRKPIEINKRIASQVPMQRKPKQQKIRALKDKEDNFNSKKGGQKRKSSFAKDLTDVSRSGVKRLRYSANKFNKSGKNFSKNKGSFQKGKFR